MNYDLAIMALEGLGKSPLSLIVESGIVTIEGSPASFKEFARLCLLMGSAETSGDEEIELRPGMHVERDSPGVLLRIRKA